MKRIFAFASTLLLSLSSLLVFATPHAFAATSTWDAEGSDEKFSTAANWSGDVAPVAGADLVFPATIPNTILVNDLTAGTSFNSLTFSGAATSSTGGYNLTGNAFEVVAGITNSMTGGGHAYIYANTTLGGSQSFGGRLYIYGTLSLQSNTLTITGTESTFLDGTISGSGDIVKNGSYGIYMYGDNSTYSGNIIVNDGYLIVYSPNALGTAVGTTTINDGADITFYSSAANDGVIIAEPLILNGASSYSSYAKLEVGISATYDSATKLYADSSSELVTLSGNITLGANATVVGRYPGKVKLTGALSGAHTITQLDGSALSLIIEGSSNSTSTANGTYVAAPKTTTYSTSQVYMSTVWANEIATINAGVSMSYTDSTFSTVQPFGTLIVLGTTSNMRIGSNATIKGTGTVGELDIRTGGNLKPGLSPGCLNSGNLTLSGNFEAELGGTTACSGYDQQVVTGTVNVTGGTLNTVLYGGFKPAVGNSFTIISNDAADAVTGTFTGLAEGATFSVSGYVFRISYVGGTGNDVVLTVVSVPATPNTGFMQLKNHPLIILISTTLSALGIVYIIRKQRKFSQ